MTEKDLHIYLKAANEVFLQPALPWLIAIIIGVLVGSGIIYLIVAVHWMIGIVLAAILGIMSLCGEFIINKIEEYIDYVRELKQD